MSFRTNFDIRWRDYGQTRRAGQKLNPGLACVVSNQHFVHVPITILVSVYSQCTKI